MRSILAGLFILMLAGSVLAQTKGEVESIGYGGFYRPDCWTPMVVRIRPGTLEPGYYQIQVEQKDRDSDTQVFTRIIQVNASDAAREQRFWMYFLPQTINHGLPDAIEGFGVRDLSTQLRVWLCNKDGKQLESLPLTSTVKSVDKWQAAGQRSLSRKLILCVSDGSDRPAFDEFGSSWGVTEDIQAVTIRPNELPESVLGYDGVDAIVWMSADAGELSRAGATRLPALTQFVKMGGKLIVTQPAERGKIEGLEQLLPIETKDAAGGWLLETRGRQNLRPLRDWAKPRPSIAAENAWLPQRDEFTGKMKPFGPFKVTRAPIVKGGALVLETIDWNADPAGISGEAKDESPYLVRWGVGLGEVTWVAQNLGDLSMTKTIQSGWVGVWDRVLGLRDDPTTLPKPNAVRLTDEQQKAQDNYASGNVAELGYNLVDAIEHSARGAGLIVLAIVFFLIYWAASGPISYLVLATKKKKGANWPIFAACAIVATLLTVIVVRLVMGASASLHHITFVRWTPRTPAVIESRFGVYLTKSSVIQISLANTDPESASYVSAFDQHPALYDSPDGYVGPQRYDLWVVKDKEDTTPTLLNVPFRSTLKKLQARWVGQMQGIEGLPKLVDKTKELNAQLSGTLTNSTGRDLRDIYIVYMEPQPNGEALDRLFYIPAWSKDGVLNLKDLSAVKTSLKLNEADKDAALPGENKVINDTIKPNGNWVTYWASLVRNGTVTGGNGKFSDAGYRSTFPLTSLYDRLPVIANRKDANGNKSSDRFDLKRLGARKYDMSQCVAAGDLVVLAQDAANDVEGKSLSPLPYPLEVDGDKIPGTGVTFYQFALPLTRVQPAPATQPATAPASQPAIEK